MLRTMTPSFIFAISSAPIIPCVSSVIGVWTVITSDCVSSSSSVTCSAPTRSNTVGAMYGSYATTRIPNAFARVVTRVPMRPSPTTPSVFPFSSTPMNFERTHSPRFTDACASGMLRQSASSIAIVCSVAEMMFAVGALMTRMPRAVQASTSTLSRPTPARPMTRSRSPAFTSSSVTAVPLRVMSASDSATARSSSAPFSPGR